MIRINGEIIPNCPIDNCDDYSNLLMGEVNSQALSFMKTPLYVYGRSEEELADYAQLIKEHDASYDTLDMYSEEYLNGERQFLTSKRV